MKKTKMEKGITLIALIITIVVLLILAVVTIGAIRESSIITHSQKASNDYTVAQEKEQIQLALSEWQIQKNILGNTKTFKNVMESELSSSATVGGEEDGPVTITFTKTGNRYKVTEDGTINELAKLEGNDLEKYIFGEELEGIELSKILKSSTENLQFINNEIIPNASEELKYSDIWTSFTSDGYLMNIYFKYKNETYKFSSALSSGITNTDNGIKKIDVNGIRVGNKVKYDGITWTILYDDENNGLQMVSDIVFDGGYMGCNDSLIDNWNSLDSTKKEFQLSDLNNNGKIDNDTERAVYSYNNAIDTLNSACEKLVTKNDNIIDVRSVGSNPINKNIESKDLYKSEKLKMWPIGNSDYAAGSAYEKLKDTDNNYLFDFERMAALGISVVKDEEDVERVYWMASRLVNNYEDTRIRFDVRCTEWPNVNRKSLCEVSESSVSWGYNGNRARIRPVVKLKSDVQFSGSGTADDPYTF